MEYASEVMMSPIGLTPAEAFWLAAALSTAVSSLLWNARFVMRWLVANFVVPCEAEPEWFRQWRQRNGR